MTEQEQIDALKAQVNYLRDTIVDYIKCVITEDELGDAIQTTQEQCLAEVKAKAIEDACKEEGYTDCDGDKLCPTEHLLEYANNIRKQTK